VDLATSGRGGVGPFICICAIVAAFGVADAHVQGGMVGDMAFMCPEFMQVRFHGIRFQLVLHSKMQRNLHLTNLGCLFLQSFFAGLAASGALTSGLRLITKAAFDKSKNGPRKGVSMSLFFEQ
jgi:equilibrative nucleoside transporter 1/2/3